MKEGDLVIAPYKSGVYVGELLTAEPPKAKVRVLAVLKHPDQGDLHHPQRADVAMFHVRRALAHREVCNVFYRDLEPYGEPEPPAYADSLQAALQAEVARMEQIGGEFGRKALAALKELERDYSALFGNR